jgi:hypothetical protein
MLTSCAYVSIISLQHAQQVDVEVQTAAGRLQALNDQFIGLQVALNTLAVSERESLLLLFQHDQPLHLIFLLFWPVAQLSWAAQLMQPLRLV